MQTLALPLGYAAGLTSFGKFDLNRPEPKKQDHQHEVHCDEFGKVNPRFWTFLLDNKAPCAPKDRVQEALGLMLPCAHWINADDG